MQEHSGKNRGSDLASFVSDRASAVGSESALLANGPKRMAFGKLAFLPPVDLLHNSHV